MNLAYTYSVMSQTPFITRVRRGGRIGETHYHVHKDLFTSNAGERCTFTRTHWHTGNRTYVQEKLIIDGRREWTRLAIKSGRTPGGRGYTTTRQIGNNPRKPNHKHSYIVLECGKFILTRDSVTTNHGGNPPRPWTKAERERWPFIKAA